MRGIISLLLACGVSVAYAARINVIWNQTDDVASNDRPYGIALDSTKEKCIYVAGKADSGSTSSQTLKYSDNGILQWNKPFTASPTVACDVAALQDFIYVVGYRFNGINNDLLVVKYDANGDTVWMRTYDSGIEDQASGVAVDGISLYVTGSSSTLLNSKFVTIKFDQDGDTVWTKTYDVSGYDEATSITLDEDFVYVAGYTKNTTNDDFRVIKYNKSGSLQWNRTYNSGKTDRANGVAVDSKGNVYVTGRCEQALNGDFFTIKCDPNGDSLWAKVYNGGQDDGANGIAINRDRIYVTGYTHIGTNNDFLTIRYATNGDTVWTYRYNSGDNDIAYDIVTGSDMLYLTGVHDYGTNSDFRTMKLQESEISLTSPNGSETWPIGSVHEITWNSIGATDSILLEFRNESTTNLDTIAVAPNTGSYSWSVPNKPGVLTKVFISDASDYTGIRDSSDNYFSIASTGIEEEALPIIYIGIENPINPVIRYLIPDDVHNPSLKIYSSDGRMVNDLSSSILSKTGTITWNGFDSRGIRLPRGLYFVRISSSASCSIVKYVLTY